MFHAILVFCFVYFLVCFSFFFFLNLVVKNFKSVWDDDDSLLHFDQNRTHRYLFTHTNTNSRASLILVYLYLLDCIWYCRIEPSMNHSIDSHTCYYCDAEWIGLFEFACVCVFVRVNDREWMFKKMIWMHEWTQKWHLNLFRNILFESEVWILVANDEKKINKLCCI